MQESLDIVILMETKRSSFCGRRIASIWRSIRVEWEVLDSIWSSGGVLVIWNTRSYLAREVVRGRFSLSISFPRTKGGSLP